AAPNASPARSRRARSAVLPLIGFIGLLLLGRPRTRMPRSGAVGSFAAAQNVDRQEDGQRNAEQPQKGVPDAPALARQTLHGEASAAIARIALFLLDRFRRFARLALALLGTRSEERRVGNDA